MNEKRIEEMSLAELQYAVARYRLMLPICPECGPAYVEHRVIVTCTCCGTLLSDTRELIDEARSEVA